MKPTKVWVVVEASQNGLRLKRHTGDAVRVGSRFGRMIDRDASVL